MAEPTFLFVFPRVLKRNFVGFQHHLGAAYLRAFLAAQGVETGQFVHPGDLTLRATAEAILDRRPLAVGFTCYYTNYALAARLADEIRSLSREVRILCGGPAATFCGPGMLKDCAALDVCVRSYAETTSLELAHWLRGRRSLETIPGLEFRSNTGVAATPDRPLIDRAPGALDAYPDPYLTGMLPATAAPEIGLVTSRGCAHSCSFCAVLSRGAVAFHSPARTMAVLRHLETSFAGSPSPASIPIQDDNFAANTQRLHQMLELMAAENFRNLEFTALMRADSLRPESFALLRRAGFRTIYFGLESASPRVLSRMKKMRPEGGERDGFRRERAFLERIRWAVAEAGRAGLETQLSMMLGFPGETEAEGQETLDFIERSGANRYDHNFFEAVPGCEVQLHPERFEIAVETPTGGLVPAYFPKPYDVTRVPIRDRAENRTGAAAFDLIRALRLLSANIEIGNPGAAAPLLALPAEALKARVLEAVSDGLPLLAGLFVTHHGTGIRADFQRAAQPYGFPLSLNSLRLIEAAEHATWAINEISLLAPGLNAPSIHSRPLSTLDWPELPELPRWGALLITIQSEPDVAALARLASEDVRVLPPGLPSSLGCMGDACRWGSAPCPGAAGARWFIDAEDRVRACPHGELLGDAGDGFSTLRQRFLTRITAERIRRGCDACPAAAHCSQCPDPYPLSPEEYCDLRRQSPGISAWVDGLNLLRELVQAERVPNYGPYSIRSLRRASGGALRLAGARIPLSACLLLEAGDNHDAFLYAPRNNLLGSCPPDQARLLLAAL